MDDHGPGHHNRRKTACPQGHPYTPDNLVRRSDGRRQCKACTREWARRWYRAHREEAIAKSAAHRRRRREEGAA